MRLGTKWVLVPTTYFPHPLPTPAVSLSSASWSIAPQSATEPSLGDDLHPEAPILNLQLLGRTKALAGRRLPPQEDPVPGFELAAPDISSVEVWGLLLRQNCARSPGGGRTVSTSSRASPPCATATVPGQGRVGLRQRVRRQSCMPGGRGGTARPGRRPDP